MRSVRTGVEGSQEAFEPSREAGSGNLEFFRIQLQFGVIRFSRGIVRIEKGRSQVSAGQRLTRSVNVRERSREGVIRVMGNVMAGRISRNGSLRNDRRLNRPDIRLYRRILSVLRIPGKRQEADGREYREDGNDDDELDEG